MVRFAGALLAVLTLAATSPVQAADAPPAGNWKLILPEKSPSRPFWLIKLEAKDGGWNATVTQDQMLPKTTIEDIAVADGALRFNLKLEGAAIPVEIKLPKEGDKMLGSAQLGRTVLAVRMERSTLTNLNKYDVDKEIVAQPVGTPEVINAALDLMEAAGDKKAKPEEVRAWADKAAKTAEMHGPRLHRQTLLGIAQVLGDQEAYATIAVTYARQAERSLDPKEKKATYNKVLEVLAAALDKAGKAEEAKEVRGRIKKTDLEKPEAFAGRKGKSERIVLVEMFTGAECPPCVAADKAFDALGKAFKPTEVIMLQYHVHIPGPDPLTNADGMARLKFYKDVEGTPTVLLNGKLGPEVGGPAEAAPEVFDVFAEAVEPLLEKPAGAKIALNAKQKGNTIDVGAEVTEAARTGVGVRLFLVLVEDEVSYTGGNKLPVHRHVVRAFPGGIDGTILKEKTTKKDVTVDLDEVRKEANDHLDMIAKKAAFPNKERPMEMKKLKIVAFVQDIENNEILQAAQVDVK